MNINEEELKNYYISENLVLHLIRNKNNDDIILSCDVYDEGIFHIIDFKLCENKLELVYVDTELNGIKGIHFDDEINNIIINGDKVEITLDFKIWFDEKREVTLKFNQILSLKEINSIKCDILDKLDDKFAIKYIKEIIKRKNLNGKYDFMYEYTDEIINYLVKILKKYERIDIHNENKKIDFETCIKMAQEFLDEIKIDINIEKMLTEQSLVFRTEFEGYKSDGVSSYDEEKNRKIVSVNKTDDIKMVAVIVHELLHYYNQPEDNNRAMASDFLTEVISYAYELILLDKYLESEYGAEAKDMITLVFRTLMYRANLIYTPMCSIEYYKNKKLTVEGISSDGKIEIYLRDMKEFISKNYTISEELWNTIGYHLGIYCYIEYKKDPNFIYKLSKLNDSINIKSFMECIKIIGLNDINELYEKGMTNLEEYIELIKSYQEEKNTEKKLSLN